MDRAQPVFLQLAQPNPTHQLHFTFPSMRLQHHILSYNSLLNSKTPTVSSRMLSLLPYFPPRPSSLASRIAPSSSAPPKDAIEFLGIALFLSNSGGCSLFVLEVIFWLIIFLFGLFVFPFIFLTAFHHVYRESIQNYFTLSVFTNFVSFTKSNSYYFQ